MKEYDINTKIEVTVLQKNLSKNCGYLLEDTA
jgi:hypothetical protein